MPELLVAKNLTKTYGTGDQQFTALKGVSLTIHEGETVAILGKSGSGKSTLMHLLALLDTPDGGQILYDDRSTADLQQPEIDTLRNKEFGFVFQQFFINPHDSVLNNVILPLKIAGVSAKEREARGKRALEAVEMLDKSSNRASDLSGGQKQRVCIARALINEPKVIFADEPTGNLDSATGEMVEDLLFSLNRDKKITIIFVTHDEELAERCQRRIHIKDGQIVEAAN